MHTKLQVATMSVDLGRLMDRKPWYPDELYDPYGDADLGGHGVTFFDGDDEKDNFWCSDGPGSWCSWYNSAYHEIQPCDGRRVTVVYNLYEKLPGDGDEIIERSSSLEEEEEGKLVVRGLDEARDLATEQGFRYAGVLLDHTYSFDETGNSLRLDALRGRDRVVADAFKAALLGDEGLLTVVPAEVLVAMNSEDTRDEMDAPFEMRAVRIAAKVERYGVTYFNSKGDSDDYWAAKDAFKAKYGGDFDPRFCSVELDCGIPTFSVPFRDTMWIHHLDSRAVRLRRSFQARLLRRRSPDDLDHELWGNAARIDIFRYRDAALLVDLLGHRDPDDARHAATAFRSWTRDGCRPSSPGDIISPPRWYAPDILDDSRFHYSGR